MSNTNIKRFPSNVEEMKFMSWNLMSKHSHILGSKCINDTGKCDEECLEKCQFCRFTSSLKLPQLPDMVFPENVLRLTHESGVALEFCALDALQEVSSDKMDLVVSCAQAWRDSRKGCKLLKEEVKNPFDWTFTTGYRGSLRGDFVVEETQERIDMEVLKRKDRILFYHDITLFEDELHDNGCAICNVKIRTMPNSFYILLRFFLRVDGVLVRINDTRLYHEFGTRHILREYTSKEARMSEIHIPSALCTDPSQIAHLLPVVILKSEKLILPQDVALITNGTLSSTSPDSSSSTLTSPAFSNSPPVNHHEEESAKSHAEPESSTKDGVEVEGAKGEAEIDGPEDTKLEMNGPESSLQDGPEEKESEEKKL